MNSDKIASILARNSLFCDLSSADLSALVNLMRLTEFKARNLVCSQGEPANHFYAVISGVLKVVTHSEDGQEVILSMLGPGMTFGEIALLDGKARSASVYTTNASVLASIDRPSFYDFMDTHSEVRGKLIVALCGRIRTLTERVEDLSALELPARLARALEALAESLGSEMAGRRYMPVRVSQGELGSMTGASRESVNKLMRAWEEAGVVKMVDGRVQILQPEKLNIIGQQGC